MSQASLQQDVLDIRDTVIVAIAGFTVLVWDHVITFDDEVELIWNSDKGLMMYLFLLNRYLTPLGFIVNLVAFTLPGWGAEHFVRYEGAMSCIGILVAALIMSLRVRAVYNNSKVIVYGLMLLFLPWIGINTWLLTHGELVQHVSGVQSCSMIFDSSLNSVVSASWGWLPLLYDTLVFALILKKTLPIIRIGQAGRIIHTLLADGTLYYSVIFGVNLTLTIMIVRADDGVKNITAQLGLLLTVAMVSRITLNLKRQALGLVVGSGYPISREWSTHSRSGSGLSGKPPFYRLNAYSLPSSMPPKNAADSDDIIFITPKRPQLSFITPSSGSTEAVTRAPASLFRGEALRGAGQDIERV